MARPIEVGYPSPSRTETLDFLLVVAGASCSGKTTFIENLRNPAVPNRLPVDLQALRTDDFEFRDAIDWTRSTSRSVSKPMVCLHYDIFRPVTFDLQSYDADPAVSLLGKARRIAAITLWEPPERLADRNRERRRKLWRTHFRARSYRGLLELHAQYRAKKHRREIMQPWLDQPDRLWSLYAQWFRFCQAVGVVDHWTVRTSTSAGFTRVDEHVPDVALWPLTDAG